VDDRGYTASVEDAPVTRVLSASSILLVGVGVGCTGSGPKEPETTVQDAAPLIEERTRPTIDAAISSRPVDGGEPLDAGGGDGGLRDFPDALELVDGGEHLGFVAVPLGAREPRPIVIALHGGSEKPEVACARWPGVLDRYAFVVCPRGFGGNDRRLGWHSPTDTSARIARAVAAAKRTFGAWIKDTSSFILVGFSMGGTQVARVAYREPQRYRRILIGDSAYEPRPALTFARAWAQGGGERVVFLCTTSGCEPSQRAAARKVAKENRLARLNISATQVHGLSERAVESLRRDWPWLVEGAEGWETYSTATVPLSGRTESFVP
jgi:pimeloyl-ACP methyl ester carboxylesterase